MYVLCRRASRLCVNILKQLRFNTDESLFGMFDGGHNSHVPQLCVKRIPDVLRDAMMHHDAPSDYMKYAMLAMHRYVRPRNPSVQITHLISSNLQGWF